MLNMPNIPDMHFDALVSKFGIILPTEFKTAGSYVPAALHDRMVFISGQIPRSGELNVIAGRVGSDISPNEAYYAAQICAIRSLAILRYIAGGSLERVEKILRICVYVQCGDEFDDISSVADGASDLLISVLAGSGQHARTSLGVHRLPKKAAVEVDVVALLKK